MNTPISSFLDRPLVGAPFASCGMVARRTRANVMQTNIIHRCVQHSPDGFNIGYAGSGPADLALNTMEQFLRYVRYEGERVKCSDGDCFALAWNMHQDFKSTFLGSSNVEITVPMHALRRWVARWCEAHNIPWSET